MFPSFILVLRKLSWSYQGRANISRNHWFVLKWRLIASFWAFFDVCLLIRPIQVPFTGLFTTLLQRDRLHCLSPRTNSVLVWLWISSLVRLQYSWEQNSWPWKAGSIPQSSPWSSMPRSAKWTWCGEDAGTGRWCKRIPVPPQSSILMSGAVMMWDLVVLWSLNYFFVFLNVVKLSFHLIRVISSLFSLL